MKLKSYSIGEPIQGICKQYAVWGHDADNNSISPLFYIQRPKWIKDDMVWEQITKAVKVELPIGLEIK